ncbi:phage recombination protein Bet, partial [Collinsella sp. Sow4_E3]|uniref:phage recombination protein Bet n=1 Tax=Collinsella sp. Sow4_E3 TaxID=3438776 RepID=UPI003F912E17
MTGTQGSELAITSEQSRFTDRQVATLRQIGLQGATEADLEVFFHHCQRTGLDPFARQIYMIERFQNGRKLWTIQTGIDGFRLIARRATDAARGTLGYESTQWCGTDGVWRDVWLSERPPSAARVTVLRDGHPFPAVALFAEYAGRKRDGSLSSMWETKGALMLGKCAEALALRKAFPIDLSGLYTAEEMHQADQSRVTVTQSRPTVAPAPASVDAAMEALRGMAEPMLSAEQTTTIGGLVKQAGLTKRQALDFAVEAVGHPLTSAT